MLPNTSKKLYFQYPDYEDIILSPFEPKIINVYVENSEFPKPKIMFKLSSNKYKQFVEFDPETYKKLLMKDDKIKKLLKKNKEKLILKHKGLEVRTKEMHQKIGLCFKKNGMEIRMMESTYKILSLKSFMIKARFQSLAMKIKNESLLLIDMISKLKQKEIFSDKLDYLNNIEKELLSLKNLSTNL